MYLTKDSFSENVRIGRVKNFMNDRPNMVFQLRFVRDVQLSISIITV
jgi:hypothetical protein